MNTELEPCFMPFDHAACASKKIRGFIRSCDTLESLLTQVDRLLSTMDYALRVDAETLGSRGRCKLIKQGDSEMRRSFVALGRKCAQMCFALLKNGTDFNPDRRAGACAAI